MAKSPAAHAKAPDGKPASLSDTKDDLKSLPLSEVEKRLDTTPDGLSQAEATKRLERYGPNEIAEKKTNAILKFLSYLWGPIPWMIEVAVVLSGVVRHWPDFFIILLLLVANATIGFWEERQAGNAIEALKAKLATKARVKRDGKWVTPPAKELVPGDVIRLRLGDIVPADARLLDGDEISVDQSALTGESLPAPKTPGEAVFSGSIIRRGEIGALVYATGTKTYFGKTAQLVETAHNHQPFSASRSQDRQLPDRPRGRACRSDHCSGDLSWRRDPLDVAVRPGADGGRDPGGNADRAVRHHGGRRATARQETSDR